MDTSHSAGNGAKLLKIIHRCRVYGAG